jgi:hypothetical protein
MLVRTRELKFLNFGTGLTLLYKSFHNHSISILGFLPEKQHGVWIERFYRDTTRVDTTTTFCKFICCAIFRVSHVNTSPKK